MVLIKCHLCGHIWNYKGNSEKNYLQVSCTSCTRKTPNKEYKEVEEE